MSSNPKINILLGLRVKQRRNELRLTQDELAEKIDVSTRFLASIEAGKAGVSLPTLKNLSRTLAVPTDYLLGIIDCDEESALRSEINSRINMLDTRQLDKLNKIITAFSEAVEDMK